jgi:uncharacterized protein (TIGR00159 family)
MSDAWSNIQDIFNRVDPIDVLDIFLIALLIYWAFLLLRGTAAIALLRGAAIILVAIVFVARALHLEVLNFVIRNSITGLIIAVPIVFQPEIRRALERVGRSGFGVWTRAPVEDVIGTISKAATDLAARRHGALIVFERETGLQSFVDTGVALDALPTPELLEGIFFPNAPLHDGAVIMRENRLIAAGCTLPLSETRLSGEMGLRHRAGLGVTEGTDAVSLMISEESGTIAIAADGRMYPHLDETRLRGLLMRFLDSNLAAQRDGDH